MIYITFFIVILIDKRGAERGAKRERERENQYRYKYRYRYRYRYEYRYEYRAYTEHTADAKEGCSHRLEKRGTPEKKRYDPAAHTA